MSAAPGSAPPSPIGMIQLEHWTYGSAPEIGYSVLGQSDDLNLSFYASRLEGIYTPLAGDSLHGDQVVIDVLMVLPASSGRELLVAHIGPGPVDEEYRRRTFITHTAVVPIGPLASGRLTFGAIDQALRDFDASAPSLSGSLPSLAVPFQGADRPTADTLGRIGRFVSRASAETLLTRCLQTPEGRTLLLCRDSTPAVRRATLARVLEVIHLACGVPFVPAISDNPAGAVASRFQLVVAPRAFRADNTWALLENSLDAPSLPRIVDNPQPYEILERSYDSDPTAGASPR